jgi:hypothetical protein
MVRTHLAQSTHWDIYSVLVVTTYRTVRGNLIDQNTVDKLQHCEEPYVATTLDKKIKAQLA